MKIKIKSLLDVKWALNGYAYEDHDMTKDEEDVLKKKIIEMYHSWPESQFIEINVKLSAHFYISENNHKYVKLHDIFNNQIGDAYCTYFNTEYPIAKPPENYPNYSIEEVQEMFFGHVNDLIESIDQRECSSKIKMQTLITNMMHLFEHGHQDRDGYFPALTLKPKSNQEYPNSSSCVILKDIDLTQNISEEVEVLVN